ncbi:MAG TPA: DUF1223 domain-containing protein [Terriglobales bacterium]|jgi:hypothetical protein|nr:DUF1223 domain-containing protein [Terriglobales bacterium]
MSNLDRCGVRALAAFSLAAISILCSTPAMGAPANPILVELFTSEGCSDCPPADAFLKALDTAQPIPGAQLIVLEEHVDYWDDQGWRDPFSSHALTLRQSQYVDRLHVKNGPYTPQMVVDGSEAFVGSDRPQAGRAFTKEVPVPKISVQISALHVEDGKVLAYLEVGAVPSKAEVFVAIALDHAESQVLRGENGGRQLQHVAVVERLDSVGKIKKGERFSKNVAIKIDHPEKDYRVIAFVQQADEGKVLGAAAAHAK